MDTLVNAVIKYLEGIDGYVNKAAMVCEISERTQKKYGEVLRVVNNMLANGLITSFYSECEQDTCIHGRM
jgi:hypothetical protein